MASLKKWIGFFAVVMIFVAMFAPIAAAQVWPSGCYKCDYTGETPKCVEVKNTWNQGWKDCEIKQILFWKRCSVKNPCPIQV